MAHRVLRTLGREDELKASGQLDQLAASFARLDPPPVGTRRHVGPLLLVSHYLQRLGLVKLVDAAAPMRGRAMLTHGEVIAALVANRLPDRPRSTTSPAGPPAPRWPNCSTPPRDCSTTTGSAGRSRRSRRSPKPCAANSPGRRVGLPGGPVAAAPGPDRGPVHRRLRRFRAGGEGLGRRPHRRPPGQDPAGQTPPTGSPVYYRPHPAPAANCPASPPPWNASPPSPHPGWSWSPTPAWGYLRALCDADTANLRFVVPLRADTGWADWFADQVGDLDALADLDHCARRERRLPQADRTRYRGLLREVEITHPDPEVATLHRLRVAYIWSSEEAASVAEARERALTKAEDGLARIRNGLGGRYYKTRKQVEARVAQLVGARIAPLLTVTTGTDPDGKPTIDWHRNPEALTAAAELDGLYAIATNLPDPPEGDLTALDVLKIYKDQWIVEQRHRDLKQTLRVRPVFLHNDDRIHAWSPSSASPCSSTASSKPTCAPPSAPTPHYPASCPNTATPSPPPAPC